MCFGWIDSTQKTNNGRTLQRFTPRKKGSPWSELNFGRSRRLERLGMMTEAGRRILPEHYATRRFVVDEDIRLAFSQDPVAWDNFIGFPELYQRIRIDTIQRDKHKDMVLFLKRLDRLMSKARQGVMFGEWNDYGRLSEE